MSINDGARLGFGTYTLPLLSPPHSLCIVWSLGRRLAYCFVISSVGWSSCLLFCRFVHWVVVWPAGLSFCPLGWQLSFCVVVSFIWLSSGLFVCHFVCWVGV